MFVDPPLTVSHLLPPPPVHSTVLPGVHDFLRLVPATPLAHGAVFSHKPLQSDEWVVELAFRVHGAATVGVTEHQPDGSVKRSHKGGRGLAFWYSKLANPTPITRSSNPKAHLSQPPPLFPAQPTDASDPLVSLFGNRAAGFDGLGVVFDTSPGSPVFPRSDTRNWATAEQSHGVGATGVVSGIMDDGSGSWVEPKGRVMRGEDEADYLTKAVGECEAAFRNAQGLLWARISHVNHTIRVSRSFRHFDRTTGLLTHVSFRRLTSTWPRIRPSPKSAATT